ncbi:hypothetical protein Q5P01_002699 [Channa striata]|uniref:SEA domain-containing protein n=1 Tax=Channa striata TaxID=64152 RepID=A0AA88NN02_CHASR|nr:hypothetical protein Q5P01_002699 [Channa striata]
MDLKERIVGPCNEVYRKMFGNRFNHCNVKAFRSTATRVDGTEAEIEVVFNEANTTADLPANAVVVQTFVLAVNDSSNNFTVAINPNNVQLISSPVTDTNTTTPVAPTTTALISATTQASTKATKAPTATTQSDTSATTPTLTSTATTTQSQTTPAITTSTVANVTVPIYTIKATLENEPFSDELTNSSSSQFKDLKERIVGPCNEIYRKMFGNRFNHCDVKAFRSTATRVDGTVAEIEVVFNEANTTADLPTNALVVQTFVLAVNDSSNNFTVAINPNNVQVISSPVTDPNTVSTAAPTTTVTTTAATSATVAPTTAAITTTLVTFRSRLDKFTNDLNDPSSEPLLNDRQI